MMTPFYKNIVIRMEETIQVGLAKVSAGLLWKDMLLESQIYIYVSLIFPFLLELLYI